MSARTRFAPSPTGFLHIGNARTALLNFIFAKQQGGAFILRLDDTDLTRSTEPYKQSIQEDLRWLGIEWDEMFSQSARARAYEAAAEQLKRADRLYPCYESEAELALARRAARQSGKTPMYNRAALSLSSKERQSLEAQGQKPHWRFKLSHQTCHFQDLIHGAMRVETTSLSDPILIRADGTFLYMLPSVADDLDHQITHIIRGDDHLTNSAIHVELAEALGGTPPIFAHHPLMVDADGAPLSKRLGALSLRDLKARGFEAEAVRALIVDAPSDDAADFAATAARHVHFDHARLERLNAAIIHQMDWQEAKSRLSEQARSQLDERFWQSVRANLVFFNEVEGWREIIYGCPNLPSQSEAGDLLSRARSLLPAAPWDEDVWARWTSALAKETGLKGRDLYLPLRLALTGLEKGPEMKNLILLLGYERVAQRLSASA